VTLKRVSPPPPPPAPPRRSFRPGPKARLLFIAVLMVTLAAVLATAWARGAFFADLPEVPPAARLYSWKAAPGMTFLDRDGNKLATRGPRHGERVTLKTLPAYVPLAFLAAEDRRFYSHGPVDWRGVARAAWANWRAGGVVEGGSTLTQQLARTLFLRPDQTTKRKVQEAVLAYKLERRMSKDEVLELYLNRVFFGAQAYGVDAAAQTYFGKPARQLRLAEAALLAGLPKAPSRLSPAVDMNAALERSRLVIARMRAEGWLTDAQAAAAAAETPVLVPEAPEDRDFGWVLDLAQAEAQRLATGHAPDLVVRLSIDPAMQRAAAGIVRDQMAASGRRSGARQAALVALGPDGGVRALIGGVDHRYSPFNRAVQAERQPGSAFKPLVYAAALESGVRASDTRVDAPFRFRGWTPANYGGGYSGTVTVADALARSINTVAVRLAQEAGPASVASIASRFGISGIPQNPGLSIALGAYEVNLLELTSAYQVLQQDGRRMEPYLIQEITSSGGEMIYLRPQRLPARVYDAARAGEMVRMLEGVIDHGTGKRAAIGRVAAGKTGTSQRWKDAWFIGFTPDWVVGVWTGNDNGQVMNKVTGGDLPAQIWRRFMLVAHKGLPQNDFPFFSRPEFAPYMKAVEAPLPVHVEPGPSVEVEDLAADDPDRAVYPPAIIGPPPDLPVADDELPPF
jgi:penicillin-binding protein 1A